MSVWERYSLADLEAGDRYVVKIIRTQNTTRNWANEARVAFARAANGMREVVDAMRRAQI